MYSNQPINSSGGATPPVPSSSTALVPARPSTTDIERKQFVENIQKWVFIDTYIKKTNEKLREMREMKTLLVSSVCDYIQSNGLEDTKLEITDGEIRMTKKTEYTPLSYTYIEDCLSDIIDDEEQVEYIMNYLRENRNSHVSYDLKRIHIQKR
jgi:hypothetical protein